MLQLQHMKCSGHHTKASAGIWERQPTTRPTASTDGTAPWHISLRLSQAISKYVIRPRVRVHAMMRGAYLHKLCKKQCARCVRAVRLTIAANRMLTGGMAQSPARNPALSLTGKDNIHDLKQRRALERPCHAYFLYLWEVSYTSAQRFSIVQCHGLFSGCISPVVLPLTKIDK